MHLVLALGIASIILWLWISGFLVAAIFVWLLLSIGGLFIIAALFGEPGDPGTAIRFVCYLGWIVLAAGIAALPIGARRRWSP